MILGEELQPLGGDGAAVKLKAGLLGLLVRRQIPWIKYPARLPGSLAGSAGGTRRPLERQPADAPQGTLEEIVQFATMYAMQEEGEESVPRGQTLGNQPQYPLVDAQIQLLSRG